MPQQQNKINYQKELEKVLDKEKERVPTLLLHSCCAPCSSYVLEYLAQYFSITVFYYNPNIYPEAEYEKRVEEQQRLIREMNAKNQLALGAGDRQEKKASGQNIKEYHEIRFLAGHFDPQEFYHAVKGLEKIPDYDYVTTTLTISPLKNAEALNVIGQEAADACGTTWLPSDFKKKNGYRRSVELSAEYGLYRQDYCGCVFSKQEREASK